MRVIKWEPFRDVDDVFDRFFAESMRRWPRQGAATQPPREWAPAADVSETDGEYVIKAELPEVRKEDVSITVQDGVLKQHVEPGDIRPETQVVIRGEEGACGSITVMYLVNRPAELAQLLRSMPHVASVSSEQGDDSPEAQEELDRIARELECLPESGAADRVNALLAELKG